jgi:hypothetical protein
VSETLAKIFNFDPARKFRAQVEDVKREMLDRFERNPPEDLHGIRDEVLTVLNVHAIAYLLAEEGVVFPDDAVMALVITAQETRLLDSLDITGDIVRRAEIMMKADLQLRRLVVYTLKMRLLEQWRAAGASGAPYMAERARVSKLLTIYGSEFPETVTPTLYRRLLRNISRNSNRARVAM